MKRKKYCKNCKSIEKQRIRKYNLDVSVEYRQERIYIRENRVFKGIGWYCPNCEHIDWDEKIKSIEIKKIVIKHPSISYLAK